jgi:hypothetical protein
MFSTHFFFSHIIILFSHRVMIHLRVVLYLLMFGFIALVLYTCFTIIPVVILDRHLKVLLTFLKTNYSFGLNLACF